MDRLREDVVGEDSRFVLKNTLFISLSNILSSRKRSVSVASDSSEVFIITFSPFDSLITHYL
jgi:hypothetical protein